MIIKKLLFLFALLFIINVILSFQLQSQSIRMAKNENMDWVNLNHQQINRVLSDTFSYSIFPLQKIEQNDTSLILNKYKPKYYIGKNKNLNLEIYPLYNIQNGIQNNSPKNIYKYSGGLHLGMGYKNKFYAEINSFYTKSKIAKYEKDYVQKFGVITSEGLADTTQSTTNYKRWNGYISYKTPKYFTFQIGKGKHFIGNGYRSLLLSDFSFQYNYAKINTEIWKIKYTNIYIQGDYIFDANQNKNLFQKKYASLHYLSLQVTKKLNISLFETVLWQNKDSISKRGFEVSYLNPILFFRPTEFANGSPDNVLIGTNTSYKFSKKIIGYGQFIIDEFLLHEFLKSNGWWGNKYGVQIGLLCNIKYFSFQLEYNAARPFTYSHGNPVQSYTHFNQSLAHPLGNDFQEFLFLIRYQKKSFHIEHKISYAFFNPKAQENILQSNKNRTKNYEYFISSFDDPSLFTHDFRMNQILHKPTNTQLELQIIYQKYKKTKGNKQNYYITLEIKTAIFRHYSVF